MAAPRVFGRLVPSVLGVCLLLGASACQSRPTAGTAGSAAPSSPALSGAQACAAGQCEVQRIESLDTAYGATGDYQVYLPPCYGTDPAARYPVLYLLHGAGHDDVHWREVGVHRAADEAMAMARISPMIIVMPDGGPLLQSSKAGAPSFANYLMDSIVRDVDARWHTVPDRQHRAIGGISLGGGQALEIAAQFPGEFSSVGGHSAAIPEADALAAGLAAAHQRICLDVGDRDPLRRADEALPSALDRQGSDTSSTSGPAATRRPTGRHTSMNTSSSTTPDSSGRHHDVGEVCAADRPSRPSSAVIDVTVAFGPGAPTPRPLSNRGASQATGHRGDAADGGGEHRYHLQEEMTTGCASRLATVLGSRAGGLCPSASCPSR